MFNKTYTSDKETTQILNILKRTTTMNKSLIIRLAVKEYYKRYLRQNKK